jgi:hypothetical protein
MYVGRQILSVKFRNSYFIDIKLNFLKLWIFTNFNKVFPVVLLVFDFDEFSEGVLLTWSLVSVPYSCKLLEIYGACAVTCAIVKVYRTIPRALWSLDYT